PRTVHEKARKIQDAISGLEQKLGRSATEAEVARAMGLSAAEYGELLDEVRPVAFVCLDSAGASEEGDAGSLYEVVADTSEENPVERVSQRELKEVIFDRLKELPEIQRKVLALYYAEDMHMREIAEVFGLTESRICQIHSQAILAIRAYIQRFEIGLVKRRAAVRRP
ncbi:MAG TPA: sigma-70 family RNA polymerase sigma factor, partial [Elusimicrobiota bacterium]|nr:sigma-70 family RNA polymerase sigma factor [Elusimicrobiota bacterium]